MGENQTNTSNKPEKKTSKLALASFISIVISVLLFLFLLFLVFLELLSNVFEDIFIPTIIVLQCFALFLGMIAISHIKKNKEQLKGRWLVYSSLIISVLFLGFWFIIFTRPSGSTKDYNAEIKSELGRIRAAAEWHYTENGSYIGFIIDLPIIDLPPSRCPGNNYIIQTSPDGKNYLAYAGLCKSKKESKKDSFWCVDSEGFFGEVVAENIPDDIYFCPSNPK